MEFNFDVEQVLPGIFSVLEVNASESSIRIFPLIFESQDEKQDTNSSWIYHSTANIPWDLKLKKRKEDLMTIIDKMGFASAQAQSLRSPITTLKKLLNSVNQKVYVLRDTENNKSVIGFLKVGTKRLFVCDERGAHHEVDPLCILDFYVHESKQRCGFGHELFNRMLQAENISPEKLAVDRPSPKFSSFLAKHYRLRNPLVQTNNFVIYPGFFIGREDTRPPIFLYYGKDMQPIKNKSNKQYSCTGSYTNEAEALNSIKVPLCSDELKKNKTYYSSAAKCLVWNDDENGSTSSRQYRSPNSSASSTNSSNTKNNNWSLNTATHSCSSAHSKVDGWTSNHPTACSLPPVNSVPNYSRKKWDQLQSSWNILGVKPIDYSIYQKHN